MEDKPGSLGLIASILSDASINIEYAYAFITKIEKAILILKVNDLEKAIKVLKLKGVSILENI